MDPFGFQNEATFGVPKLITFGTQNEHWGPIGDHYENR